MEVIFIVFKGNFKYLLQYLFTAINKILKFDSFFKQGRVVVIEVLRFIL